MEGYDILRWKVLIFQKLFEGPPCLDCPAVISPPKSNRYPDCEQHLAGLIVFELYVSVIIQYELFLCSFSIYHCVYEMDPRRFM